MQGRHKPNKAFCLGVNVITITIDEKSIAAASAGQLDLDAISRDLHLPESSGMTKSVNVDDHGYMLSRVFQAGDALLTISLMEDGPLAGLPSEARHEALGRLLRCTTLLLTGRLRAIPPAWRPYHYKNRLTFQADRRIRGTGGGRTNAGRVVIEFTKGTGPCVFAFGLDRDGRSDLSAFRPNMDLLSDAMDRVGQAIVRAEDAKLPDVFGNEVALDNRFPSKVLTRFSFEDWYKTRLTTAQRRFVDYPMNGSVRLVGAAGSGKTVALVVKCLKEIHKSIKDNVPRRVLFLTHAFSTAMAIENLILSMDPEYGIELLASDQAPLVVTTLYSLANGQMRYKLDDLTPVSLDGHEGRVLQADWLNEVIEDYRRGDWVVSRSRCSGPFVAYMEADRVSMERRFFLWELLNEFACVLDADGVRSGPARREQYLSEKRKNWMMALESREEREVVLRLYDDFRTRLRNEKAIGGDQMIADFLNHLDSFRWEATRHLEGFDAVFVDELHLFNRQERMVFRHLMRNPSIPPVVLMAYDAKQSPRDTFLGVPGAGSQQYDFWKAADLGKVEKIELVDVFRYSPQIAQALSCIDQSFPGQDLDDEWPAYRGIAKTADGPVPIVCEVPSIIATYAVVFKRAQALQRNLGRGGRVAVLCASNELFGRYLEFPTLRSSFHAITSREEAFGIPYSQKKFIFSMPEFVAGLQFHTVLLIDVNRFEVPDGPYSAAALRKFVSQVYLGASRAERILEIYASRDDGGIAPLVSRAVMEGVIQKVDESALSRA